MATNHPATVNEQCKELTTAIAHGDMQAFDQFYSLTASNVYGYCFKMTGAKDPATDLLMRTYTTLWEQRTQLPDMAYPRAYVIKVASRLAYRYLRDKNGLPRLSDEEADIIDATDGMSAESREIVGQIEEAATYLPPEQQVIFRMSKFDGQSHQEIANHLGISISQVTQSLAASMQSIRAAVLGKQ